MAEEKIIELVCLLDRSLSMYGREAEICEIANSLIRSYRSRDEKCFLSVCLFSEKLDVIYMHQEDRFARELTARDYYVSGNTAFYDAFRESILCLEHTLGYLKEHLVRDVDFYLLTDGTDNASIRATPALCEALLAQKREQNWRFWQLDSGRGSTERNLKWKNDVSFV